MKKDDEDDSRQTGSECPSECSHYSCVPPGSIQFTIHTIHCTCILYTTYLFLVYFLKSQNAQEIYGYVKVPWWDNHTDQYVPCNILDVHLSDRMECLDVLNVVPFL